MNGEASPERRRAVPLGTLCCEDEAMVEGAHPRPFYDTKNPATEKHSEARDRESGDSAGEEHDGEQKPGGRLADKVLRYRASVERRRTHGIQNEGRSPPERNKCEHGAGGD